jgi:nucleoside-diphosphate-sugar epimerase
MASSQALGAESPRRNILVTGATGKQGTALIRALLHPSSPDTSRATHQYHIYALTRKASSPNAQSLSKEKDVMVVEGDLDVPESISKIFEDSKSNGGIWGVYAVLAFPGLGAPADGEERQGKVCLLMRQSKAFIDMYVS